MQVTALHDTATALKHQVYQMQIGLLHVLVRLLQALHSVVAALLFRQDVSQSLFPFTILFLAFQCPVSFLGQQLRLEVKLPFLGQPVNIELCVLQHLDNIVGIAAVCWVS